MRRTTHRLARLATIAVAIAAALNCAASAAWADGDPASDVLATQPLFLPQDAGVPAKQQAQLGDLLNTARRSGYPVRVALISSPADLGSITELWRQPQTYARFLGEELSLVYRGPVLVVMPNGFGFYRFSLPPPALSAAVSGLRPASGLASAALSAVQRLAARAGHRLRLTSTAPTPASGGASDPTAWIVLALGAVLVAAAWALSLRARPPQLGRGTASPA